MSSIKTFATTGFIASYWLWICLCRAAPKVAAVAKDGIQLIAVCLVTVRTNIDRLVGGAGEETIIARVGERMVSTRQGVCRSGDHRPPRDLQRTRGCDRLDTASHPAPRMLSDRRRGGRGCRERRRFRNHYELPCVVSINNFTFDTPAEIELLKNKMAHHEAPVILARHWAEGGAGAADVARTVVELIEKVPANFKYVYEDALPLWDKIKTIGTKIYGASDVTADATVRAHSKKLRDAGYGHYPVCVAKTQYSFSTDPQLRAAPSGHVINVREVRLAAGAEFVVITHAGVS